jgi:hypothetical protein
MFCSIHIQMCKLYFCRIVPETQCQVAILSRAIALLVLSLTGDLVRQQHSSQVMVTCSLELTLVPPHSMVSHLMAAILQHLEVTRQGGINLQTSNLSRLPLALAMTIITNNSNRNNNNLLQELVHLLTLVPIITASLLLMLLKVMVILPTLSRAAGSKLMITLVIRTKGSNSRPTLSRLDMISKAMAQLVMDQLQTQLRMVLLRATVVQVGLVKHPQGNKRQLQLLEAPLFILANHLPVLHQATRHKLLPLNLDTLLPRHRLAMAPNPLHRVGMDRVGMGSLPRVRNHLRLLLMDRHHLLDLLWLAMGSMVTASQAMVHRRHTLVPPLQVTLVMANSSRMVILMVVVAMGSLRHILLKLRHLLRPKTNLLLPLRPVQQMLLPLPLPTAVVLKLQVELYAPASATSVILLLCSVAQFFLPWGVVFNMLLLFCC